MAGEHLPEDIIMKILSKLPVKSLIRFRCVSKRWRSIVSDPQFARLQFKVACEQQTVSRRFIFSSRTTSPFESLDLESTTFQANSSIRKLDFPFPLGNHVKLLCSCNGLVCVALDDTAIFYIWNPSIGFTHRLPDPCYSSKMMRLWYYGFGYVSATDDYKLLLFVWGDSCDVIQMLSLRDRNWKKIEDNPFHWCPVNQGVLLNEALHWLNCIDYDFADLDSDEEYEPAVIAFDLAREEFWKMPVPIIIAGEHNYRYIVFGVSCDGCLYVICSPHLESLVSVEFWVMREYGKGDSWTKLFNLKNCNPPKQILSLDPVVVMQNSAVLVMRTVSGLEVLRIDHHEDKRGETSTVAARDMVPGNRYGMIGYEESLLWLSDYLGVEETMVSSNRIKTQHEASPS